MLLPLAVGATVVGARAADPLPASPFAPFARVSVVATSSSDKHHETGYSSITTETETDLGGLYGLGFGAVSVNFNLALPDTIYDYADYLDDETLASGGTQVRPIIDVVDYSSSHTDLNVVRLADDIAGNGQAGVSIVRADIDGDGVVEPDEIVGLVNSFGDLHTFNVYFDEVRTAKQTSISGLEVMKQFVFGPAPGGPGDGWRVDAFHGDWLFGAGDEVRGLTPLTAEATDAGRFRRWLEGLRSSLYGSAGLRWLHLEDRFAFEGLGSILGRTWVSQDNDHDLFGPQVGVGWVVEGPTLRFEAALLGLVGYGRIDRHQRGVYGQEVIPGALNRSALAEPTVSRWSDSEDQVAWNGEARLTASCQLTQRLRFDATWRWIISGPVAPAYDSIDWAAPGFGLHPMATGSRRVSDLFLGLTYSH